MKKLILTLLLCIMSALSLAQNRQAMFDQEASKVIAARDANKIDEAQMSEELVALAKTFFPNDFALQAAFESRRLLGERLRRKEITMEQFNQLWADRWNRFTSINASRHADAQQQAIAELEEIQRQRNVAAAATAIRGVGNAARSSTAQPGVNCTSTEYGGTTRINCR